MKTQPWSCFAKTYDPLKIGSIDGTDTEPHDKAVIRAINSNYKPNKHVKGRPNCTIFVSRLSPKTTKDTIKEVFSKFGRLQRFRLVKDIVTGFPKGYAFIEYESESSAEEAYRKAYKMNIDGHTIFVDFECERLLKDWKPRRLGGGFGGRKESGQLRFGCRDRPFRKPISLEIKEHEEKLRRETEVRGDRESAREDRRRKDRRQNAETVEKKKYDRDMKRSNSKESRAGTEKESGVSDKCFGDWDKKRSRSKERTSVGKEFAVQQTFENELLKSQESKYINDNQSKMMEVRKRKRNEDEERQLDTVLTENILQNNNATLTTLDQGNGYGE